MMDDRLLSLRLSADYPGKPDVLKNVSLELGRGEVRGSSAKAAAERARWRSPSSGCCT